MSGWHDDMVSCKPKRYFQHSKNVNMRKNGNN